MVAAALQVELPGTSPRRWHVGPFVDSIAYHWSWLFALVPMTMMGDTKQDYLVLWAGILALNFAHRHLTIPIVYCDKQIFGKHSVRFTLVPIGLFALFLVEPAMRTSDRWGVVFITIATISGVWGIWHTVQQKYGILRLYAVKSGLPAHQRPPPWVDRLLVHGWFPLWIVFLGTAYRELIELRFARANLYLEPILNLLPVARTWLLPASALFAGAAVAIFLWHEWRSDRFGNPARLFMGIGTAALSVCFVFFDPAKVFLSYAFSHAVEYFVFVWAYQRKRYASPHRGRSPMERMASHPALFYGLFAVATGGVYVIMKYWGIGLFREAAAIELDGISGARWVYYWGLSQSMLHFYYDGFLWKMRSPETRANI